MDIDHPCYRWVFNHPPIFDGIFSCLDHRSLLKMACTCRAAYGAIADFHSRAYNINRHFSRYFTDPVAFRSLQARTNTLVSGSDALQFLDRTFYPEADLDLYTHPGHSFEVAQFLVHDQGYQFIPREDEDRDWRSVILEDWDGTQPRVARFGNNVYPLEGISAVWTFEKTGAKQETLKVQIIEASSSPVEAILDFHTTCVMNFISSDAAYSLYPKATFVDRRALGMEGSRHSAAAIQKYVQRGWRVYFMPTPDDLAHPASPPFLLEQERWVGDKHSWVLPLNQTGVMARPPLSAASAPLTFDPVRCNGWRLRPYRGITTAEYECHSYRVQTTVFRYNYGVPNAGLQLEIRRWANIQGRGSHATVSREDWVWFDADLPGFLPLQK